jgi:hypothetical protein
MPLRRPAPLPPQRQPTDADIDRVINAGSPPPAKDETSDVKFQMVIPSALCAVIDKLRRPTRTSRRAWILQAVYEKLEREDRLPRL